MDVTWDDNGVDEVSYNYFMKCDRDWSGHHHGGSDAETSIAPIGKTAKEYYSMVPNYNLIDDIILILVFAIPVGILGFILYKKKKTEFVLLLNRLFLEQFLLFQRHFYLRLHVKKKL